MAEELLDDGQGRPALDLAKAQPCRRPCGWTRFSIPAFAASRLQSARTDSCPTAASPLSVQAARRRLDVGEAEQTVDGRAGAHGFGSHEAPVTTAPLIPTRHGHVSGGVGQAPGAGAFVATNRPLPPGFGGFVPESRVTVPPKFAHSTVEPLVKTTPTLPCDGSPSR